MNSWQFDKLYMSRLLCWTWWQMSWGTQNQRDEKNTHIKRSLRMTRRNAEIAKGNVTKTDISQTLTNTPKCLACFYTVPPVPPESRFLNFPMKYSCASLWDHKVYGHVTVRLITLINGWNFWDFGARMRWCYVDHEKWHKKASTVRNVSWTKAIDSFCKFVDCL